MQRFSSSNNHEYGETLPVQKLSAPSVVLKIKNLTSRQHSNHAEAAPSDANCFLFLPFGKFDATRRGDNVANYSRRPMRADDSPRSAFCIVVAVSGACTAKAGAGNGVRPRAAAARARQRDPLGLRAAETHLAALPAAAARGL